MKYFYAAPDLLADLASAVPTVLSYASAGIGVGIALALIFMGIREGIAFFRQGAGDRRIAKVRDSGGDLHAELSRQYDQGRRDW